MDMFAKPVVLLTLAMFLAIGIERLLELVRAVFDHLEARQGKAGAEKWEAAAYKLRNRIEVRLNNARSGGEPALQLVLSIVCRYLGPPSAESGGLIAISVDQVRSASIRLRYKILAVALGIALAFLFQIDVFALVDQELNHEAGRSILVPAWLGIVVSGAVMGFGAGPVHKIITALEEARRLRK